MMKADSAVDTASSAQSSFVRVELSANKIVYVHFDPLRGTVADVLAEALRMLPMVAAGAVAPGAACHLLRRDIDGVDTKLEPAARVKDSGVERCQLLLLRQE